MIDSNNKEQEIISQIRQSLEVFEEPYLPGAWEDFVAIRSRKRRIVVLRFASGIAACLIAGLLGYWYFGSDVPATIQTAQQWNKAADVPDKSRKLQADSIVQLAIGVERKEVEISRNREIGRKKEIIEINRDKGNKVEINRKEGNTTEINRNKGNGEMEVQADQKAVAEVVKNTMADTVAKPQVAIALNPTPEKEQSTTSVHRKRIRLGINFAPGINGASSAGAFNYAGGISADLSLSENFQLSTGLQYESRNLTNNASGILATSGMPVSQTRTRMTSLDVPLNITWQFYKGRTNSCYISSGLSSMVYLSQLNKNTLYSQDLIPTSTVVAGEVIKSYDIVSQVSVSQNTVSPGQVFDLAGRFNLIFGIETRVSDGLFLHLEPFAKIPVAGTSSGNINRSSAGINFKISF